MASARQPDAREEFEFTWARLASFPGEVGAASPASAFACVNQRALRFRSELLSSSPVSLISP